MRISAGFKFWLYVRPPTVRHVVVHAAVKINQITTHTIEEATFPICLSMIENCHTVACCVVED